MLKRFALGASSQDVEIGTVDENCAGEFVIQVTGTIGSGTIAVKGYLKGKPKVQQTSQDGTALATTDAVAIPYYTTSTGVLTSGATAINALGIYRIVANGGVSVILSYTAAGGSDLVVHCRPIRT